MGGLVLYAKGQKRPREGLKHYLSKVEPHLFAVEVRLVQPEPCFSRNQSVAETDPHPPERLEVLELHLRVKRTEQRLKPGLKWKSKGEGEGRRASGRQRDNDWNLEKIRAGSSTSTHLFPSVLLSSLYLKIQWARESHESS